MTKAAKTRAKNKKAADQLPEWNLGDLYSGPEAPKLKADLKGAQARSQAFAKRLKGRLATLSGAALGAAIAEYESFTEILHKAMSYAHLYFAANTEDADSGRFYQTVYEQVNAISTETLFFTLELNRLPEAVLRKQLKSRAAARYASWIRDVRVYRPHMLDDDLEKILHEKSVTGRASWVRLFDETQSAMRFPMGRKRLTMSEVLNLLSDKDGEKRKRAAKALGKVLGENVRLFTLITNTLAKDKGIEDEWRHYPSPLSSRNLGNYVEDEVVEALTRSVADAFPDLSHRYYRLKARWFGKRKLDYWDRNAPLPGDSGRRYSWPEARELVLSAYGRFAPEMAATAKRFFTNAWIDAVPRAGKDSGAFSHSTVPSVHPYILMNFQRQGA